MLLGWSCLHFSFEYLDSLNLFSSDFLVDYVFGDLDGILFNDSSFCNFSSDILDLLASVESFAHDNSFFENNNSVLDCWSLLLLEDLFVSLQPVLAIFNVIHSTFDDSNSDDSSSEFFLSIGVGCSSKTLSICFQLFFVFCRELFCDNSSNSLALGNFFTMEGYHSLGSNSSATLFLCKLEEISLSLSDSSRGEVSL